MKTRIHFIVNPNSGTSSKKDLRQSIEQLLDKNKYEYTYHETERAGHAIILTKEAVNQKVDIVAVCGGDGTVNEVASQLINTQVKLAILPGGSGNGFAGHLGIPRNVKKAIEIINIGASDIIDSCMVNDKTFVNIAGIGFDGLISYRAKGNDKRGLWMYLKTTMKEMGTYEPPAIDVNIDGEDLSGNYATVAVANASMYGYSFTLAPEARLQDGMFDIILIKKASLITYLLNAYRFLNKSLHKSKHVIVRRSSTIQISSKQAQFYHIDGEGFKTDTPLEFSINTNSLQVIYNQSVKL